MTDRKISESKGNAPDIVRLIRSVQKIEGNPECFKTAAGWCDRLDCLWREYCLGETLNPQGGRMKTTATRSMEKIVEDQVLQWQKIRSRKSETFGAVNVITISREYGSGGVFIAEKLAKELGYDLFHQEIIQEMAKSANISKRIVKTLDEKGLSTLEEAISALINERHLWPDQYLRHLMQVVGTIGRHGRAVIVGRGAHLILPVDKILRIRVICPLPHRIKNIAKRLNVSEAEARKIVLKTDADRRSFVRKYFYIDASDPLNYDVVVNTGRISYDTAVESIIAGLKTLN